jgi:hypothetical protein
MVIRVNDEFRITSSSACWQIEKRVSGGWRPITFHTEFKYALRSLAEYRVRLIADAAKVEEIKATLGEIREEALKASAVFAESVP